MDGPWHRSVLFLFIRLFSRPFDVETHILLFKDISLNNFACLLWSIFGSTSSIFKSATILCCSHKKDKHVYCLSLIPRSLLSLSLSFCKTFHKNEIQFPLLNFSKYLVENEFTWSFTDWCTPVIEHDHVPGILFGTRNKKTRFLPLKSLQNVLFGRYQHGSKKRGWSS